MTRSRAAPARCVREFRGLQISRSKMFNKLFNSATQERPADLGGHPSSRPGTTNYYHRRAQHEYSGKWREVPVVRRINVAKMLHAQALGSQHEERSSWQRP